MKKSLFLSAAFIMATTLTSCGQKSVTTEEFLAECAKKTELVLHERTNIHVVTTSEEDGKTTVEEDQNFYFTVSINAETKEPELATEPADDLGTALMAMVYIASSMPVIGGVEGEEAITGFFGEDPQFYTNPYQAKGVNDEGANYEYTWDNNGTPTSYKLWQVVDGAKMTALIEYKTEGKEVRISADTLNS